jgi:uncharacterized protein YndB with AHSA1/START domain
MIDTALSVTRVFDAPPEVVFSAWSDPTHVKRWWHPRDFTTPSFEMDFRVGGTFRYCIRSNGRDSWAHGTYREIVAPERLAFTFQWESGEPGHDLETLVTITFEAQGDKTLMTFRQTPFDSERERQSHTEGWSEVLDAFGEFLAERGTK